jgi:hypothetical protein
VLDEGAFPAGHQAGGNRKNLMFALCDLRYEVDDAALDFFRQSDKGFYQSFAVGWGDKVGNILN